MQRTVGVVNRQENPPLRRSRVAVSAVSPLPWINLVSQVMSVLFIQIEGNGLLHWKDAVALGAVNTENRELFSQHQDSILQPLLDHLEGMSKSNIHYVCNKIYAPLSKRNCTCTSILDLPPSSHPEHPMTTLASRDPRYKDAYDNWTTAQKCSAMTDFLAALVDKMRQIFQFQGASMIPGVSTRYPRRLWLIVHTFWSDIMQESLKNGKNNHIFNRMLNEGLVFYADGGSLSPGGMESLLPLAAEVFCLSVKATCPSPEVRALLGPHLFYKLIMWAPFYDAMDGDHVPLPCELEDM